MFYIDIYLCVCILMQEIREYLLYIENLREETT